MIDMLLHFFSEISDVFQKKTLKNLKLLIQ